MERTISKSEKYKQVTAYGLSLAALLFLLKFIELRYLIVQHSIEVYAGLMAVGFTALGIWVATKLIQPKLIVVEKEVAAPATFISNKKALEKTGISPRELEVLQCIAQGFSNQEIADRLFVSESTVKTHAANLNLKLEAGRRTQAVEKAKKLGLIS